MKSTPEGPTTSDAVVPPTSTTSVNVEGSGAPSVAHGTGMISTNEPYVVVIVEQAVTLPVAMTSPLVIMTSGGPGGAALLAAATEAVDDIPVLPPGPVKDTPAGVVAGGS